MSIPKRKYEDKIDMSIGLDMTPRKMSRYHKPVPKSSYSSFNSSYKHNYTPRRCTVKINFQGYKASGMSKESLFGATSTDRYASKSAAIYNKNAISYNASIFKTLETAPIEEKEEHVLFTYTDKGIVRLTEQEAIKELGDDAGFSIILSPEDKVDLEKFTITMMNDVILPSMFRFNFFGKYEKAQSKFWVASKHWNTDHPHVHIRLSNSDGIHNDLRLPLNQIKYGYRKSASIILTNMLGPLSVSERLAREQKTPKKEYTQLDMEIENTATVTDDGLLFEYQRLKNYDQKDKKIKEKRNKIKQRLRSYCDWGLAKKTKTGYLILDSLNNQAPQKTHTYIKARGRSR